MAATIGYDTVMKMILSAVEQIRQNHQMLSQLDSATGDGDHGTTMVRTMTAVENVIQQAGKKDLRAVLGDIAWAVMGSDGGSTSPLLGAFFQGMSDAVAGKAELTCADMVAMFDSAVNQMHATSRANVGDKTMMDALLPARDAMKQAALGAVPKGAGDDFGAVLGAAALASLQGAAGTRDLVARVGRARNLGERSRGTLDPGAMSISLIFKGFLEGYQNQ